jgi:beta-galactosidase
LENGGETSFTWALPVERKGGKEYTVTFSIRLKGDAFYAPKGYETGSYQFYLGKGSDAQSGAQDAAVVRQASGAVTIAESGDTYTIIAHGPAAGGTGADSGYTAEVSGKTGLILSLKKAGKTYLEGGFKPTLNRPMTGLDVRPDWGWYDDYETIRHLVSRVIAMRTLTNAAQARLEFDFIMEQDPTPSAGQRDGGVNGTLAYTFNGNGSIDVDYQIHIDERVPALPRVGLELVLPAGFEALSYYGYGPNENYRDRKLSATLGLYHSTVTEQHFPFVPPSENGGHEETRWVSFADADKRGIRIAAKKPFHFDAHHSSTEDYRGASHDHKLLRRPQTFVHIDAAHGPIGSEMAWSTAMPREHKLKGGSFSLQCTVELF